MYLAQGHNTATSVRIEPPTSRYGVYFVMIKTCMMVLVVNFFVFLKLFFALLLVYVT